MTVSSDRFYTWVDVESRIRVLLEAGRWPDWLQSASAYTSGIEIQASDVPEADVVDWLKDSFGFRIRVSANGRIDFALDGRGERSLPISIETVDEDRSAPLRFLFEPASRVSRVRRGVASPTSEEISSVPLFAFHSFKGGVGRTTSALALALELAGTEAPAKRKVLLIDADMEAPGISFLLERRVPDFPISFADFLALANESLGGQESFATDTTADALRSLEFNGIFVLPAFRAAESYESVAIRPEHLIRNSMDPFVVSRLVRRLGAALGVDAIVVDLRAGISEVSAGLVLDPTVNRVLVTTLGGQSIRGTRSILSKIVKSDRVVAAAFGEEFPSRDVTLVFSQVREEQKESMLPGELEMLVSEAIDDELDASFSPRVCTVDYVGDLALMSRSWDACLEQVSRSNIGVALRSIADTLFARDSVAETSVGGSIDGARRKLSDYSQRLEYAESGAGDSFLVTAALDHLASDHFNDLPLVAVVGQKGAGKSYTYLQLVRQRNWSAFVAKVLNRSGAVSAPIFPLLEPQNLTDDARRLTNDAREEVCNRFGGAALGQVQLRDLIREGIQADLHEGKLRQVWLSAMASSLGVSTDNPTQNILDAIATAGLERIVFVVDGLEDLLQNVHVDEYEQRLLRSLLNDVASWLSQIPGRPIGLLVFVRRDMVLAAIKQNPGQFFHRYLPYELKWDREEALRLVGWVANQSGAASVEILDEQNESKLAEYLVPLWGLKLGSDDSREARVAEWVLAALSDFRGQVQARDVVRLIKFAADASIGDLRWSDRVLTPPGLRKAPVYCGQEKVREIEQETPRLKAVFAKLRAAKDEERRIPFSAAELGLTIEEIELLERGGIVMREPDGYYMPEMYRQGLGFAIPKGARPRVLALARRAGISSSRFN